MSNHSINFNFGNFNANNKYELEDAKRVLDPTQIPEEFICPIT